MKTFCITFVGAVLTVVWFGVADNMIAIYLLQPNLSCTAALCSVIMGSPVYAIAGVLMNCAGFAAFNTIMWQT